MELIPFFIQYLSGQKNSSSANTLKNYKADVSQFLLWLQENTSESFHPSQITQDSINKYKLYKTSSLYSGFPLSERSFDRHLAALRLFCSFLVEIEMLEENPIAPMPKQPENDPYHLALYKTHLYTQNAAPATTKNYLLDISHFLTWLEKTSSPSSRKILNDIDVSTLEEYKARLLAPETAGGRGLSPVSVNRKLSAIKSYFVWLHKKGFVGTQLKYQGYTNTAIDRLAYQNNPNSTSTFGSTNTQESANMPRKAYSKFPPLRLAQKIKQGISLGYGKVMVDPLAKLLNHAEYLDWKRQGRHIFVSTRKHLQENSQPDIIKKQLFGAFNHIPKQFYAPLETKSTPLTSRIAHILIQKRPKWYLKYHSYSVVHYLHFSVLMIVIAIIGFSFYQTFVLDPHTSSLLQAKGKGAFRVLSFQGRLSDADNNPIIKPATVTMTIYNDATQTDAAKLWQETTTVTPTLDGAFSVLLGNTASGGQPLPQSIFTDNPSLWLGIMVNGDEELFPRQKLPTVHQAEDASSVSGLLPITSSPTAKNVLLALDSAGNLTMGDGGSSTFQVTSGQFTLSGQTLVLTTAVGSDTDVQINPDGAGRVDIQKPIHNTSNYGTFPGTEGSVLFEDTVAILAKTSTQSAFLIDQNDTGTIISAQRSGIAKFAVENDGSGYFAGNLGVGTATSSARFEVNGTIRAKTTGSANIQIDRGDTANGATLDFLTAGVPKWIAGIVPGGDNNSFSIRRMSVDSSLFQGLHINSTGMMGIGTTASSNTLTIKGSLSVGAYGTASAPSDGMIVSGNTGIGTATPHYLFTSVKSAESTSVASIVNTVTTDAAANSALRLGVGTASSGTATRFIQFFSAATQDNTGTGVGNIRLNNGGVAYTSGNADFAEYFTAAEEVANGDVVSIGTNGVKKSEMQQTPLGVVSDTAGFIGNAKAEQDKNQVIVGLIGQIKTKVSTQNGTIAKGDYLTTASTKGVAVKATTAGPILGKALEDFTTDGIGTIIVYVSPGWYDPEAFLSENGEFIVAPPNGLSPATKNYSLLHKATTGTQQVIKTIAGFSQVFTASLTAGFIQATQITTNSLAITTDNVTIAGKSLKDYIADQLHTTPLVSPVASIAHVKTNVISPLSGEKVVVQLPAATSSALPTFEIQNASGTAVAVIDNTGNASFSGQLSSNSLNSNNASVSGTLTADRIVANSISGLDARFESLEARQEKISTLAAAYSLLTNASQSSTASSSAQNIASQATLLAGFSPEFDHVSAASMSATLAQFRTLHTTFGSFDEGLIALGPTSLTDASISNNLTIGTTQGGMTLAHNSINVIGNTLELQPLRQGMLSFMGGAVTIDTSGNLYATENASFSKDVTVHGAMRAGIISPLPNHDVVVRLAENPDLVATASAFVVQNASSSAVFSVNSAGTLVASGSATLKEVITSALSIIRTPQVDASMQETIASSSAGTANIIANETERTITNPLVSEKSLIYISPTTDTDGIVPYIARQTRQDTNLGTKGSFTIQIPRPLAKDISFNWWIIN